LIILVLHDWRLLFFFSTGGEEASAIVGFCVTISQHRKVRCVSHTRGEYKRTGKRKTVGPRKASTTVGEKDVVNVVSCSFIYSGYGIEISEVIAKRPRIKRLITVDWVPWTRSVES
jgi:hypothetical protein